MAQLDLQTDPAYVLCKALFNTQDALGLNQQVLGDSLGLDRSSISRLKSRGLLDPASKQGELATYLIRIYRSLYVLMGSEPDAIRHWMNTYNLHLQAEPVKMIAKVQGLVQVLQYLDAIRAKV